MSLLMKVACSFLCHRLQQTFDLVSKAKVSMCRLRVIDPALRGEGLDILKVMELTSFDKHYRPGIIRFLGKPGRSQ